MILNYSARSELLVFILQGDAEKTTQINKIRKLKENYEKSIENLKKDHFKIWENNLFSGGQN